ncbi:unnamed protein product [Angiostrongylus costaricensis]|uniref:Uncharacterized protein n=1 Tax=Angiostrongylus costaricensis TaxID=334426 RepID=A0A3P7I178_ANGCS|nr:unnamed protein product [Angiostrongylus costaricensis]
MIIYQRLKISVIGDERECASNICLNGGTCLIEELSRRFLCRCPPGLSGSLCQETCNLECANGVCVKGALGNEQCQCAQGTVFTTFLMFLRCIENERGLKICTGDQCKLRPCKNNATCVLDNDSFRCICPVGFAGKLCGSDVNECELMPCQNGGTCINMEGSFECLCENGFSGKEKSMENKKLGTCAMNPCRNQGTCVDTKNGFHCACPSGFEGKICQYKKTPSICKCPSPMHECLLLNGSQTFCNKTSDFQGPRCNESLAIGCDTHPCRNGGICQNVPNGFRCYCSPEFGGETCEEIMKCLVDGDPCLNEGRCVRGLSDNHCECASNFTGRHCERSTVIPSSGPCSSNPCLNGGICHADGIVATCECQLGFGGVNCSNHETASCIPNPCENDGVCQSVGGKLSVRALILDMFTSATTSISCTECVHSDKCVESSSGSSLCICQRGYQGPRCDQRGDPCDSTTCSRPLMCQPHISFGEVRTTCVCPVGRSGTKCQLSTSVSFDKNSLFIHQSPNVMIGTTFSSSVHLPFTITFAMRTTVPSVHIVSGENIFGQKLFSVALDEGQFVMTFQGTKYNKLIPFAINDGTWYTVRLEKSEMGVIISVVNEEGYQLILHSLPFTTLFDVFATRFGKVSESEYLVGCIADVNIGGSVIDLASSSRSTGITYGSFFHIITCYISQCSRNPCMNGGHCVDLWTHASCLCAPPFLPPHCRNSLPPSTFGHNNQTSFVEIVCAYFLSLHTLYAGSLQDIRINGKSVVLHKPSNFAVDQFGSVGYLENILEGSISDDICGISEQCVHGTCHNTFNDFDCNCKNGFYGKRCERKDHCFNSPCPENGECKNVGDGYICKFFRWSTEIHFFSLSLMAFEMSGPVETTASFKLTIRTHSRTGHILTIDSKNGTMKLSLTNGQPLFTGENPLLIRKNIADGQWHTIALDTNVFYVDSASYGCYFRTCTTCNNLVTSCLSSPQCGEASPCVRGECRDLWNAFACECPPGFEGEYCEININECSRTNCGRGYCFDGIGVARCYCDPGYTGPDCDVELDFCAELPCRNGGLCESSNGNFMCECRKGWSGKFCDIKVHCAKHIHLHFWGREHPTRVSFTHFQCKCLCMAGFVGEFCEEKIDPCRNKPCIHGYCESDSDGFSCKCDEGYFGKTCSSITDLCTSSSCNARGRCTPVWNATMCTCDKRWRGRECNQLIDECMTIPCENDGICETTAEGFQCHCRKYYLGYRCEVLGSCLKQPCERGECIQLSEQTHSCSCPTGYEGERCEVRIDYCIKNPCLNGGLCESLIGQYKCHCITGFTGVDCETDIDECQLGFCSNGAICRDRVADYDCICDGTGFTGKNCTIDINECTVASNCVNGQCTNTQGGYRCDCENGFIGSRCTVRDPCWPDAFNRTTHTCVHGVCINPSVMKDSAGRETSVHECKCHWGYTGPQCITQRKMLALSYILGPMAAVLTVLAILGCVLLVFVFRGKRALHGHYSPSYQEQNGTRLQMNSLVKLPPEERLI